MIIIGVDPGIATTGYGVIKTPFLKSGAKTTESKARKAETAKKTRGFSCLSYGLIKTTPRLAPAERLYKLSRELNKVINKYRPEVLAIESIYFFKNLKTAMPVSQAKGVILLTAAKKKIPVFEFTPLQVKMVITGYGRAEKRQIQEMIKILLGLDKIPSPDDAADALGIAVCCALGIKHA
jgi:crossover junction endodeoxyribonuclease RuvC